MPHNNYINARGPLSNASLAFALCMTALTAPLWVGLMFALMGVGIAILSKFSAPLAIFIIIAIVGALKQSK
jgi:hypothetical protein